MIVCYAVDVGNAWDVGKGSGCRLCTKMRVSNPRYRNSFGRGRVNVDWRVSLSIQEFHLDRP